MSELEQQMSCDGEEGHLRVQDPYRSQVSPMSLAPQFDAQYARRLLRKCDVSNVLTKNPQEPGLRAVFAVLYKDQFPSVEEACRFYGCRRQRFTEWNKYGDHLREQAADLFAIEATATEEGLSATQQPHFVEGDLTVTGANSVLVSGAEFSELFDVIPEDIAVKNQGSHNPQIKPRQVVGFNRFEPWRWTGISLKTKGAMSVGIVSDNSSLMGGNRQYQQREFGGRKYHRLYPDMQLLPVCWAGWPGQVMVNVPDKEVLKVGDLLVPSGKNDGYAVKFGRGDSDHILGVVQATDEYEFHCFMEEPRSVLILMGSSIKSKGVCDVLKNIPCSMLRLVTKVLRLACSDTKSCCGLIVFFCLVFFLVARF